MWRRCTDPSVDCYPHYGGRGIRVCKRWELYENFVVDMGLRPSRNHTLDRVDNDGHYEPDNVRWADRRTQANNRRNNQVIHWRGEAMSLASWCQELGLPYAKVWQRINKLGWPIDRAFTEVYPSLRVPLVADGGYGPNLAEAKA